MTKDERMAALAKDPRVLAVIEDSEGYLVHLARGWRHFGHPWIFGRKLPVIHGTALRECRPDPKAPPELRGWVCEAPVPTGSRKYFGVITERHPGGVYWKIRFKDPHHRPAWHSIKSDSLENFHPPDHDNHDQTTSDLRDLLSQ